MSLLTLTQVAVFVIVTLVYFQLLEGVKRSDFLNVELDPTPSSPRPEPAPVAPVTVRRDGRRWIDVPQTSAPSRPDVFLRQVIVSLDAAPAAEHRNVLVYASDPAEPRQTGAATTSVPSGLLDPSLVDQLVSFERDIRAGRSPSFDTDLCYRTPDGKCFAHSLLASSDRSSLFPNERTYVMTLGFDGHTEPAQSVWEERLLDQSQLDALGERTAGPATFRPAHAAVDSHSTLNESAASTNRLGFSFSLSPPRSQGAAHQDHASLREMRSVRWMAYAARAFVLRFWGLAKKADSADIAVMLIGYLLMHATFVTLYLNMRKLGSKVWLATSTLVSSTFAFLFALLTAYALGLSVNPILLSEALPFLVIVVGFEKPFVLARAVFSSPDLSPTAQASSEAYFSAPKSLHHVPSFGSRRQWNGNLLDPNAGSGANMAGSSTGFATPAPRVGVRWAPPLPAADIVVKAVERHGAAIVRDYAVEVAVLALGACSGVPGLREFCRLAALILTFDCINLFVFYVAILTVMVEVHRIRIMRGLKRVDSSADLARILDDGTTDDAPVTSNNSKRSSLTLRETAVKLLTGTAPGEKTTAESPTARLKLLLIVSFLTLHALNLLTTLTASTAFSRHESPLVASIQRRVDYGSASVSPVLDALNAALSTDSMLVARIPAPIHVQILVPGLSTTARLGLDHGSGAVPLAILDSFMTAWTRFVGDPVMSKWIVIALGVSVFLNGYLLKGLATGPLGSQGTAFAPTSAAEAAARILLASTRSAIGGGAAVEDDDERKAKMRRRWSSGGEHLPRLSTLSLADAAERAQVKRAEMVERMRERDASISAPATNAPPSPEQPRRRLDSQSSEDSEAPLPLFVKPRSRKATADGINMTPATSSASATTIRPGINVVTDHVVTPPTASTSFATTPATTVVTTDDDSSATSSSAMLEPRDLDECEKIFAKGAGAELVSDEEVILLVQKGRVAAYALEKLLKDTTRAVRIRRALISRASTTKSLESSALPFLHYNYAQVIGQCCENVVGYVPLPVGIAGPLRIDGEALPIPMATTEGALVASTSRGCKALNAGGGVTTVLTADAMTRGPALEFPSITMCADAKAWIESEDGSLALKAAFNSTSRFARLLSLKPAMAGRKLYVRFATQTGDAMGMNMISKGTERALEVMLSDYYPEARVVSLSGNYCIDKKPSAQNWINGRGKSVVGEAVVPGEVVKTVLKTTVDAICKLNVDKNLIGSALAGSIGGNNAHAANIVAALFLACGQDPAQVVESSMCMTLMEPTNDGRDLLVTVTMPAIEVGTIGGGTVLSPQQSMLRMLGVDGANRDRPGDNAKRLARIICAAVMAGELSLMAALAQGSLVKSHLALNRSVPSTPSTASALGHTFLSPAPTRPGTPGNVSPAVSRTLLQSSFTPIADAARTPR